MASRFSLVNRGYEVEKVGPSTTNRYLLPPRKVGEITPTTNLRDEKNAKGPLAKVKLTPETQTGDSGLGMGISTAQQAANTYAGGNLRGGEFDTTSPSSFEKGLVAVGRTVLGAAFPPAAIAFAIEDYQKLIKLNNIIEKKFQTNSKNISLETKNKIDKIIKKS